MKKIIVKCCQDFIVEQKDLKIGVYKKKGERFVWKIDQEIIFRTTFSEIFLNKGTMIRDLFAQYELLEDIRLKYVYCPICKSKVWLDEPYNGYWILNGKWKVKEVNRKWGDWEKESEHYGKSFKQIKQEMEGIFK